MSKKAGTAKAAGQKRGPRLSTIIGALVTFALLPMSVRLGQSWIALSRQRDAIETELATRRSRNVVLQRAAENLELHRFQVCNKGQDAVSVPWVAAVYHDGKRLKLFDAARCTGWRTQDLAGGENRVFHFSSAQEGCNWNGAVTFYAMRLIRESEDGLHGYSMAGPWRNFDRDCFNLD